MIHFLIKAGIAAASYAGTAHGFDASSGCGSHLYAPIGGPTKSFDLISAAGGGYRTYGVFLPSKYDQHKPMPLILAFHGKNQVAATFEKETQLSDDAVNSQMIAVFPQGHNVSSR